MNRLQRLLFLSFVESVATILVERGVYFYSRASLDFTDVHNLWLALGIGVFYVLGALGSHSIARIVGERRLLYFAVISELCCHAALTFWISTPSFLAINLVLSAVTGCKWPVVESYISAGRSPLETAKALGLFNLAWATAVPLALLVAGPLIQWHPPALFVLAGAMNVISLALLHRLEKHPVHLPLDHPQRLPARRLQGYRAMLVSSRWSMVTSYTLLFVLAPLAPGIFAGMGYGVAVATAWWAINDLVRVGTFLWMQLDSRWHGKLSPLLVSIVGLPAGFFLVLFGGSLPLVVLGEVIFGFSAGVCYYAALYYAMVVQNASVEAGGHHEGLIGLGFSVGPGAALIGRALTPATGSYVGGMLLGVGPLTLVGACAAVIPLWKERARVRDLGREEELPEPPAAGPQAPGPPV